MKPSQQPQTDKQTTDKEVLPDILFINGENLIQLPSTPKSGLFKFCEIKDHEVIHLYELDEIPKHYHSLLKKY